MYIAIVIMTADMDVFTAQRRSEIMARIRGVDTAPELAVRRYLLSRGFRFRTHRASLPGKPDIVLPKHRAAVYVHGCFWHGHTCKDGRRPRSNQEYWNSKLDRNVERDQVNELKLRELGWRRVVIWGCQAKSEEALAKLEQEIDS